jgi:long-chain acyl-CoA synthetase
VRPPASGWDAGSAPWLASYPAGVPAGYRYPDVPLGRLLDDAAQDFPETVAVEYRGYTMTYRKLLDHADRFATALAGLGVARGDRVALVLPTCPQLVIALFAAWRIGALVTLDPPGATAPGVADGDTAAVVAIDRAYRDAVAPVRPPGTHVIVTSRGDYLPFPRNVLSPIGAVARGRPLRIPHTEDVRRLADLVRRNLPASVEATDAPDTVALRVAGCQITQRRLVVNAFQLRLWLPDVVAGDERVLLALPPSAAAVLWIVSAVLSAATTILVDDSRAAQRQRSAVRARPTLLPLDQRTIDDLLRSSWRRGNLRTVRIALSHAPVDASVADELEELTDKGRIRCTWGLQGLLTHADPIYGRAEPGSVGLPLPDTEAVVADARGVAVPVGTRGRLWVRGPQLASTGWTDAGIDAAFDADGYLTVHEDYS